MTETITDVKFCELMNKLFKLLQLAETGDKDEISKHSIHNINDEMSKLYEEYHIHIDNSKVLTQWKLKIDTILKEYNTETTK